MGFLIIIIYEIRNNFSSSFVTCFFLVILFLINILTLPKVLVSLNLYLHVD